MQWKLLTAPEEIEYYLSKCEELFNVRCSLDYLKQGKVWGLHVNKVMVAGFALIENPPFRTLNTFTERFIQNSFIKNIPSEKFFECQGFWIDGKYNNKKISNYAWLKLLREVFYASKPYLIWGYNPRNQALRNLYINHLKPTIIYEGDTKFLNVPSGTKQTQVSMVFIHKLRFAFNVYMMLIKRKIFFIKDLGN